LKQKRLGSSEVLEHVPTKLHDFVDKDMLQIFVLARFHFGEAIPLRREAR